MVGYHEGDLDSPNELPLAPLLTPVYLGLVGGPGVVGYHSSR